MAKSSPVKGTHPSHVRAGFEHQLFDDAAALNNATYMRYYTGLKMLAMTAFEWVNLPDSISERFLEMCLFDLGNAIFINDDSLGYLALKVTQAGPLNVYEEATRYQAYSVGYSKLYDADKCVLIRNNYLSIPSSFYVQLYAYRLYQCERTCDVNIKAQRTPVLIVCDESQRLTMKNLYMKYEGNEPFIFGFKGVPSDGIKALKTDAPYIVDKINDYKNTLYGEIASFFGIESSTIDKRERLVSSEADALGIQAFANVYTMLKTRKEACDAINKMFGLNIDVRLRQQSEEFESLFPDYNLELAESSGQVTSKEVLNNE